MLTQTAPVDLQAARSRWHPIATSSDLVKRHVFQAQLLGREFAVWRADDGHVNVWENRCLHRGVRLSIGVNDGQELVCQYHGWRYANRTAGCTYIPAHPADSPARTICNNTYPVIEYGNLIWTCEDPVRQEAPNLDLPFEVDSVLANAEHSSILLRPVPVNASIDQITPFLLHYCRPQSVAATDAASQDRSAFQAVGNGPFFMLGDEFTPNPDKSEQDKNDREIGEKEKLLFFLQPVDSQRTIIRGLVLGNSLTTTTQITPTPANQHDYLRLLRRHNGELTRLRDEVELSIIDEPALPAMQVTHVPVGEKLAGLPALTTGYAKGTQRVVLGASRLGASGIRILELEPLDSPLTAFQPGAHIDVQLGNGMTRQYSLTNGRGQTDRYVIAVKRESESTGGSAFIHDSLRNSDVLTVSDPRNNFPLRRDAMHTVLIAGGIGMTPLFSMAQALHHSELSFSFHYFVQSVDQILFADALETMGSAVTVHTGLSPSETNDAMQVLLSSYTDAHHVYLCGPGPMLNAARTLAATAGWPEEAVHFEFFNNDIDINQEGSFTVELARSGLTLEVGSGQTLLEVLRDNGVDLPSSCEQGACGTCRVGVLSGEPLHQDVCLNETERTRGDCMMTCVSRALSESLVLDI